MGLQIGLFESGCLPPGLHIPPNVRAALIANGWTAPGLQIEKQPEGIAA